MMFWLRFQRSFPNPDLFTCKYCISRLWSSACLSKSVSERSSWSARDAWHILLYRRLHFWQNLCWDSFMTRDIHYYFTLLFYYTSSVFARVMVSNSVFLSYCQFHVLFSKDHYQAVVNIMKIIGPFCLWRWANLSSRHLIFKSSWPFVHYSQRVCS